MSASGGGYPPGFGAPPGFAPGGFAPGGAAPGQPPVDFVLDIPADPNWQPIEFSDTLEMDGFYQCKIIGEKVHNDQGKLQIIMTLEIQDPDARGKKLTRFMDDPRQTQKDTWWRWRSLFRSITGTVEGGQSAFRYTPGALKDRICYVKTAAYVGDRGDTRTGIDNWSTDAEWREAYGRQSHRWPAKPRVSNAPGVGALPGGTGGMPGALPGASAMPALPGASTMPGVPGTQPQQAFTPPQGVPAPGAAPMQQAPQQSFAPPPAQAAPPAAGPPAGFGPPPAQTAPVQTGFGGGFGPPPAATPPPAAQTAPAAPIAWPPPPAQNGVPQPTAAGVAGSFPGTTPPR